jgi:glyoxylase-like metal-dependent hydrolase (beta-lactamase superfamily II)
MAVPILPINLGMVNCFLLAGKKGYLLVDSGYAQTYETLIEKFHKLNINTKDIHYLLLTHHHDDHCGAAALLQQICDLRLIIHKNMLPFLEEGSGSLDGAAPISPALRTFLTLYQKLSPSEYRYTPVIANKNDIVLKDDDHQFLPSIGIAGSILTTPGHTNNSLSLVLEGGDVICGDIAFNYPLFELLGARHRPIYVQDEAQVYRSWQKIKQHGGKRLFPGHGRPFSINKLIRPEFISKGSLKL